MNDLAGDEGEYRDPTHPGEQTQSYFERSVAIRVLLGLLFVLSLFLFLHFREAYVGKLELGNPAERPLFAPLDFLFSDEAMTLLKKQEAAYTIGTIYRLEEEYLQEQVKGFQQTLSQERDLEEALWVVPLFADFLRRIRFTDPRTLHALEKLDPTKMAVSRRDFYSYLPEEGEQGKLPASFWSGVQGTLFTPERGASPFVSLLLTYFASVEWRFEIDQGMEYTLRQLAQNGVEDQYTEIHAGDRLIDKGDIVTTRHMALVHTMKERMSEHRHLLTAWSLIGTLLMTLILVGVSLLYLAHNHRDLFHSNRKLTLLLTIFLLALLLAKGGELFLLHAPPFFADLIRFPLLVPFPALLATSLIGVRIATFLSIFLAILFALALPVESMSFLVINAITAMVVILAARHIRRRKELFSVCAKGWLASVLVILAFHFYDNTTFTFHFMGDCLSALFCMMTTAILVVGLLPILEAVFQIMTDITLMEFLDPSNPLLRRLTVEAPGTYQHSMVVGHLAEAAASAIGVNGLFCRAATQYHDIGKLTNPQYFTENQLDGIDMHQLLTPLESTQVIIAHVSEGVILARKFSLPERFIDIIKEHHGTTLVYYFYHKQVALMGGDKQKVLEADFRYTGPKPTSKESTIIMIADTLEAATRSLEVFNEETVANLAEKLILQKVEDGQLDSSPLTFEELGIVKATLVKALLAASHPRVKYPSYHPGEEG